MHTVLNDPYWYQEACTYITVIKPINSTHILLEKIHSLNLYSWRIIVRKSFQDLFQRKSLSGSSNIKRIRRYKFKIKDINQHCSSPRHLIKSVPRAPGMKGWAFHWIVLKIDSTWHHSSHRHGSTNQPTHVVTLSLALSVHLNVRRSEVDMFVSGETIGCIKIN